MSGQSYHAIREASPFGLRPIGGGQIRLDRIAEGRMLAAANAAASSASSQQSQRTDRK